MNETPNTPPTPGSDERQVEWSFDFSRLGESFKRLLESLAGEEEIKTSEYTLEKAGVSRAEVDIHFSVGSGTVRPFTGASEYLVHATLKHVGEIVFRADGDAVKHIELEQKMPEGISAAPLRQGFRALTNSRELQWDVLLTPDVPLNLEIDGGVGPVTADLTGLNLTALSIDSGVGTMHLTLPAVDAPYTTHIDGGVGQVTIIIPDGASGKIKIEGGVGSVDIVLAAGAAVQLSTEQGLGSVSVPAHFRLLKEEFMSGKLYQTEGYELADKKLVILYEGGVGQLKVTAAADA
jgi:hypothetical protein